MAHPADGGPDPALDLTPQSGGGLSNLLDEVRRMRILIVNDPQTDLAPLRAMLEGGGFFNLVSSHSHAQALHYLHESIKDGAHPIDAVLLDIVDSEHDGYTLCRMLRTHPAWENIPAVLVSPHELWQEHRLRSAYEAGATDIIFKPFRGPELLPRVVSCLALKRERDLRRRREIELEMELAERNIIGARLQYLVAHDNLTGLSNRRCLEQGLELAVQRAADERRTSALLYLDLDQFKVINDSEGHAAGDRLLISVANHLRRCVGASDTLARIGSDEFGLLIEDVGRDRAVQIAEELRRELESLRFEINSRTYHIGTSIGLALVGPGDQVTASELLARADQACFVAKKHGRNRVHIYSHTDTEMHALQSNAHWVPRIRKALRDDRFVLVFQPVQSIRDRSIRHFEVLIRMLDEDGSVLEPGEFIAVAERMGLIHEIDLWVVARSIEVLAGLPSKYADVSLKVNLSGHAFQNPSLLPLIRDKLMCTKVRAERITFEITETAAIANLTQTRDMVDQLRALGCRLALDDFGSGFNSYSYLKQFPVDYLKIDGSFIIGLMGDPIDQTLVKSMVEIARTLDKKTVAEFVANEETLALLAEYGVDYAQGYYIGRPVRELREHLC
jgi:diguanylate cyclase (GGDEF)-like protein